MPKSAESLEQPLVSKTEVNPPSRNATLIGWIVLVGAVFGGAFCGIFFYYIQIECQLLKYSWRKFMTALMLAPIAYKEIKTGFANGTLTWDILLDKEQWKVMAMSSLGSAIWLLGVLIPVNYTTIAHAYVLNNMPAVFIVIFRFLKGIPLIKEEIAGTIISTLSSGLLALDHDDSTSSIVDLSLVPTWKKIILGDGIALLSSAGGALFLTWSSRLKSEYPTYTSLTIMCMMITVGISILSVISEGATFSFDPNTGIFGFLSGTWFLITVENALVTELGSYVLYLLATKYFDALFVSISSLAEPIFSSLVVFFLGWQNLPGPLTWLAFCLILPSIAIVSYGQHKQEKEQEAKLAIESGQEIELAKV